MGLADDSSEFSDASDGSLGDLLRAARTFASSPLGVGLPEVLCGGRIRVGRTLGSGSMGTVYSATERGRPIAVKTLNHCSAADIYRLKNEFRHLTELVHPNLVMVHELVNEGSLWFFTMEAVDGCPLGQYWGRLQVRDATVLKQLLRQIVEGVCAIHDAGLLHRDIKLSNIMVEETGRVVVVDFGLVGGQQPGSEGHTVAGQICGTPAYMAPELLLGSPCTASNDWYAVGVVLYQLLAVNRAFSESIGELLAAKSTGKAPELHGDTLGDAELEELCLSLLRPEPSRRPQSKQLLAQVRTWDIESRAPAFASAQQRAPSGFLIGRAEPLRQLEVAYRRAIGGTPTLVWLSGPSGIGKTRLLSGFADYLAGIDDPVILQGRCFERESVPHKAFDSAIDHFSRIARQLPDPEVAQLVPKYARYVARLFPVLLRIAPLDKVIRSQPVDVDAPDALVQKRRGLSGFKDLLQRLSERRRLVIFLDDMQWADEDSLNLLNEVLCPPDQPPMLVVATSRLPAPSERFGAGVVVPIALEPMAVRESEELVGKLLPPLLENREVRLRTIVEQAEGLPLYVVELVRAHASGDTGGGEWSLQGLFQRRVLALASDARALLEVVVAAQRALPVYIAEDFFGPSVERLVRVLRSELLVRESIRDGVAQLEPEHDHVGRVTRAQMSEASRRATHSRLADWLARSETGEAEWLVSQLLEAGRTEEAAAHADAAARSATARLAFHSAVELFALALTRQGTSDSELNALRVQYAEALSQARRCDEAALAFLEASRSEKDPDTAVRLRAKAATQWIRAGYLDEGVTELRSTLRDVGIRWPDSTASTVTHLLIQRARVAWLKLDVAPPEVARDSGGLISQLEALTPASTVLGAFDYLRGAYFSALTLPLAMRSGHSRYLLNALASEGAYRVMLGGADANTQLERLTAVIRSLRMPETDRAYREGVLLLIAGMSAFWSGRWGDVHADARAAELTFEERVPGASWETTLARSIRHTAEIRRDPSAVGKEIPSLLRAAEERTDRYDLSDLSRIQIGVDLAAQRVDQATRALTTLETELERRPVISMHHLVVCTRVQILLEAGAATEASSFLDAQWRICRRRGLDRFPLLRSTFYGMTADILEADTSLAPATRSKRLRRLASRAEREPVAFAAAMAASMRASATRLDGNWEQARELELESERQFRLAGFVLSALAEKLISEPEGPAAVQLRSLGVAAPLRWCRRRRCLL